MTDPFCPVFNVVDMLRLSGQSVADIAVYGGGINVDISWRCDLDRDFMSHCRPEYSFTRLDDPLSKGSHQSRKDKKRMRRLGLVSFSFIIKRIKMIILIQFVQQSKENFQKFIIISI